MVSAQQNPAEVGGGESREEILQAAAELFMEFGYAATSIDAVAQRLGATKGRIYHHYRSKADLFFDVQVAAMTRLTDEIDPIARGGGKAVERLSAMALRHTQILLKELPMQKVAVQGLERHLLEASAAAKRLWYSQRRLQSDAAIDDIAHTLAAYALRGLLKDSNNEAARATPLFQYHLG
jgi:AcrR family transcriptional regulator